jgi:hypothetical protein
MRMLRLPENRSAGLRDDFRFKYGIYQNLRNLCNSVSNHRTERCDVRYIRKKLLELRHGHFGFIGQISHIIRNSLLVHITEKYDVAHPPQPYF